jgi:hypothetical protein
MFLQSWIRYSESGKPETLVIRLVEDADLEALKVKDVEIYSYSEIMGIKEKKFSQT